MDARPHVQKLCPSSNKPANPPDEPHSHQQRVNPTPPTSFQVLTGRPGPPPGQDINNDTKPLFFTAQILKMGREDQIEEREVLDSIFPDEITGPFIVHGSGQAVN